MNGWRYKSAMPVNQPACCSSHSLEYKCSGKGAAAPKTFTVTFQHSGTDFQGFFSLILYRLCKRPDEVWIMKIFYEKSVCQLRQELQCLSWSIREAPFNLLTPPCGHCPNSIYTPPPHSNGHSGALFSGAILPFYHFYHFFYHFLPFFYHFL